MIVLRRRDVDELKARFPTLVEMGYVDDAFVAALLAADALGCRPCDVRAESVEIDEGTP